MTTGIGQKQNPRKPQRYVLRRLFFAIVTQMAQKTMLTTMLAARSPIGLVELHDDGVYSEAVTGCCMDCCNGRIAFGAQDILHLHGLDNA